MIVFIKKYVVYVILILIIIILAYNVNHYNNIITSTANELKTYKSISNNIIADKEVEILSLKDFKKRYKKAVDSLEDVVKNFKPTIVTEYKYIIKYDTVKIKHDSVIYKNGNRMQYFSYDTDTLKYKAITDTSSLTLYDLIVPNTITFLYGTDKTTERQYVKIINSNKSVKVQNLKSYIPMKKKKWYDKWYFSAMGGVLVGVMIAK